jgi:hypothetical protein
VKQLLVDEIDALQAWFLQLSDLTLGQQLESDVRHEEIGPDALEAKRWERSEPTAGAHHGDEQLTMVFWMAWTISW